MSAGQTFAVAFAGMLGLSEGVPREYSHQLSVKTLEDILGRKANKRFVTMPPTGDVIRTHANVTAARQAFGYTPQTSLREGLAKFVAWYQDYYPAPYEESRRSTFKS